MGKNPLTNFKLLFRLVIHAAWSMVELVRACDNLTYFCSHFNKHLLACSGAHNPPECPCPRPGKLCLAKLLAVAVRGRWARKAGGFWPYLISKLLWQLLNPWQARLVDLYLLYLWGKAWGSQNGACPPRDGWEAAMGRAACVFVGASPWAPSLPAPRGSAGSCSLAAKSSAEAIIIYLALCCSVLWGNSGSDPSLH